MTRSSAPLRHPIEQIRNISIIAHIDHGKSTLSDRILELTGAVDAREMREQYLDSMDIERERGITIKAQNVRVAWRDHVIHLIDTPGHVDFGYEVSRSLAACEGVVLVVDAAQGIEAQTLANCYLALENDLEIVAALNKIDLPAADPDRYAGEIEQVLGIPADSILRISAKTGEGVPALLDAIVGSIPPPEGDPDAALQGLIFDSYYDQYRGVVSAVRIVNGTLHSGARLRFLQAGATHDVEEIGVRRPVPSPVSVLGPGEVGYIIAGIKDVGEARSGETVTEAGRQAEPLEGYRDPKPMVFCGLFPVEGDDYADLRDSLEKLRLNDASFTYDPETSGALGFGFRCGFLGLLHMDIVQERLEREYNMDLITTAPTVIYQILLRDGTVSEIENPSKLPDLLRVEEIREPVITATILMPQEYVGPVITLCTERRGTQKNMQYLGRQVMLTYELPLAEVVMDFFDKLKSVSRGYASLDYEFKEFTPADVVKLDILINGERVDALSVMVHRSVSIYRGREVVAKMRKLIPRQMFDVAIQASIGAQIIARETIKAMRKNVLAKCYGGDITRKKKLLEKQKAGKKRMKAVGSVEIPQEAFLAILQIGDK